jgi:hypothetical protein
MLLVSIAIEAAGCAGGSVGSGPGTAGESERNPEVTQFSAGGATPYQPAVSGFLTADKTAGFRGQAAKRPELGFHLNLPLTRMPLAGAVYLLESFEFNDGELEILPEPIKLVPPRSELSVGFRFHSGDDEDDFALVQSTTDSVTTPSLRTFRNVVRLVDDDDDDADDSEGIYFAPGVGIVREDWNDSYDSGEIGGPAVSPNGWVLSSGTLTGLAVPVQP